MYIANNNIEFKNFLNSFKSRELVPLLCPICQQVFQLSKNQIQSKIFGIFNKRITLFCSRECKNHQRTQQGTIIHNCSNCNKIISKKLNQTKKTKNHFCSHSCSASYNNTHKTKGIRRSKLEIYLESQLTTKYPNLNILFNSKEAINSELDIFIPSLKLAFELNGIFHYEPIYGTEKLASIQNNDTRKFQACLEKGIELCIIDTSSQKYFKENTAKKFLEIIISIINSH